MSEGKIIDRGDIARTVRMRFTPRPGDGQPIEVVGKIIWLSNTGESRVILLGDNGNKTSYPVPLCRVLEVLNPDGEAGAVAAAGGRMKTEKAVEDLASAVEELLEFIDGREDDFQLGHRLEREGLPQRLADALAKYRIAKMGASKE